MKNFYERYWRGELDGRFSGRPEWTQKYYGDFVHSVYGFIGKRILDFGCGEGGLVDYLRNTFFYFDTPIMAASTTYHSRSFGGSLRNHKPIFAYGCDIVKSPNLKTKFFKLLNPNIPFQDGEFETIFAIEVFEHILDMGLALSEIARVIKKDGYLIITTTDYNWLKKLAMAFVWEQNFYPTSPHIRFFTKSSLRDLLKSYGFELVSYQWNQSYFGLMPKGQVAVYQKRGF